MANLKARLTSVSPLLMHNGQTADPQNRFSKAMKEISGKRKKTDADFEELARLEWYAGLYVNDDGKIIIPSDVMDAVLINGAKKSKQGSTAKSAIWVSEDSLLNFPGHEMSIDDLWKDEGMRFKKAVKIGTSKVMRTRPIFKKWHFDVSIEYDELQLNKSSIVSILKDAGRMVGVCDWRPKYGRFEVEII